jgi:hypothetical protein
MKCCGMFSESCNISSGCFGKIAGPMLVLSPHSQCCILLFQLGERRWLPIYQSILLNVIYEPLSIVTRLTALVSSSKKSLLSKEKGRMSALDGMRETLDGSFARSRVLLCPSRSAMS